MGIAELVDDDNDIEIILCNLPTLVKHDKCIGTRGSMSLPNIVVDTAVADNILVALLLGKQLVKRVS